MKALITGATGFIGSHLAESLCKRGYEVDCLIRKTSNPKWLEGCDIKFIEGDCTDKKSIGRYVRDYDYIFHLAGLTKAYRKEDFYTVNTNGTENIIKAVSENNTKIKRFVYLSSLSAFGPKLNHTLPCESHHPHPVSDYGRSKLEGEGIVLSYRNIIPVTILRPSVVYGPRDREFFLFFKIIKKGFTPYLQGHTSLIYIDDLVRAIILVAEKTSSIGETYFVSDGTIYSNNDIITEIASALNVKGLKIRLPRTVLRTIGFFGEGMSKIIGKSSMINKDKMREIMYHDWVCDISKAKNEFNFESKVGIKEGIKWTANWYRIHKWL